MANLIEAWVGVARPVVGMVHLGPLPGSAQYAGHLGEVRDAALHDAELLAEGGVHGLMIENFGDVPFFPDRVPAHAVAHITAIAAEVRRRVPSLPIGINVLRNDGRSALAVAHAVGASFIRVNVLSGARVTDQGVLQGIAHELMRERSMLGASNIKVFADVDVKHSAALAPRPLEQEVYDTIQRGLADAVIVSGEGTGQTTDLAKLKKVHAAAKGVPGAPVFIGSGATAETVADYVPYASGFIVGTSFKVGGVPTAAVDVARVRAFMARLSEVVGEPGV